MTKISFQLADLPIQIYSDELRKSAVEHKFSCKPDYHVHWYILPA